MDNSACCYECAAIAKELVEAYAEAWSSSGPEFKDAGFATYNMIGGTEDHVARAEELPSFPVSQASARISRALLNKFAHETRSGHQIYSAH